MYESHYGFTEKPFNLTPDPKYLYPSPRHAEAFAHLEFGRRERGGFIVITGEVGTGKTTLARYFLSRLDARTATAFVLYPALTAAELLRSILDDLHVPVAGPSLKDQVDALHQFLLQARRDERQVVLLIDEAQDLSAEVLEQIRLISNLETDTEKLIQIVLMGQSELQELLGRRELRQLAQRVTARYHLMPLSRAETEDYVRHRLKVAGGEGKVTFTAGALAAVHGLSGGVPRLINLVCDRALLAGFVAGSREINVAMVRRAAAEVRGETGRGRRWPIVAGAAAAVVLIALGSFLALRQSEAHPPPSSVAPAAVAATAPPMPATEPLEPLVLSLDREASRRGALAAVQGLWGPAPLELTTLNTHLEQIRRLNLPVVLEMVHPARRDACYVALLRMDDETADVAAGGDVLRVRIAELDRLWTRQAFFLWRDFEALATSEPTRTAEFARASLGRLGYLDGAQDLTGAVTRFQRDAALAPDGIVGARTLMALYSLGAYPRPRLGGAAGTGGAS